MTTTKNNEHKKLNFSSEREQSQACLNSAEHEKNQGRKVLNVPNLRFPEFQGEWEEERLADIADLYKGTGISKDQLSDDGEPCILYGELYTKYKSETIREVISKTNIDNTKLVRSKANDVIIPCSGETAEDIATARCVLNGNILLGGDLNIIRLHGYDGAFMSYQLNGRRKYDIAKVAQGVSVVHLYGEHMKGVKTINPCLKEQKKIASLLALLDERISTQNKIIDKLQSLIKGIVDCTILHKEKNAIVGDVCSISEQIRAEANIDDIITVRLHGNGVCKSSAENLQLGATQYYRRKAGQLIYGKQNFHNGAIGIVPISLDNGITSKDIPSFDIDEMKCNSVYLLAQLQSPQYYKPAEALTTGTGSKRLKEETFLKMPIVLPNKREQDDIAVLIHRASMNLDHAKRLLELLSIQKQFLLRQMFI